MLTLVPRAPVYARGGLDAIASTLEAKIWAVGHHSRPLANVKPEETARQWRELARSRVAIGAWCRLNASDLGAAHRTRVLVGDRPILIEPEADLIARPDDLAAVLGGVAPVALLFTLDPSTDPAFLRSIAEVALLVPRFVDLSHRGRSWWPAALAELRRVRGDANVAPCVDYKGPGREDRLRRDLLAIPSADLVVDLHEAPDPAATRILLGRPRIFDLRPILLDAIGYLGGALGVAVSEISRWRASRRRVGA